MTDPLACLPLCPQGPHMTRLELALLFLLSAASCYVGAATYEPVMWVDYAPGGGP